MTNAEKLCKDTERLANILTDEYCLCPCDKCEKNADCTQKIKEWLEEEVKE